MHNVLPELLGWWQAREDVALATVIGTWRSAPLQPGTSLLVGPDRSVAGSVSGGCVEADVYEIAEQVLADGRAVLRTYGVSDEDAFGVGLTCGGIIDIFVQRVSRSTFPELEQVAQAVAEQRPIAVATVVRHPDPERLGQRLVLDAGRHSGTLGDDRIDLAALGDVEELLATGRSGVLRYGFDGPDTSDDVQVFVECFATQPRLLVFGANDFAGALAALGTFLGYRVTVCDARPLFATGARFPNVDDVVVDWPHRYLEAEVQAGRIDTRTAICVLTHDPKFDLPLLKTALTMPINCYVGAMGSRRTDEDRRAHLREQGLTPAQLRRLSSPIGLDLGARTPQQTAVSILAEIIATQTGSSGARLANGSGPIHHEADVAHEMLKGNSARRPAPGVTDRDPDQWPGHRTPPQPHHADPDSLERRCPRSPRPGSATNAANRSAPDARADPDTWREPNAWETPAVTAGPPPLRSHQGDQPDAQPPHGTPTTAR